MKGHLNEKRAPSLNSSGTFHSRGRSHATLMTNLHFFIFYWFEFATHCKQQFLLST